jgi:hypothetical protein
MSAGCPYRKSNPHVLMVQSTKDRPRFDTPGALNEPSNRKNPRNSGLPEISTIDAESRLAWHARGRAAPLRPIETTTVF